MLAALLWSLSGTLIKLLNQNDGLPALTIACYRSLLGGALFLPFALRHLGSLRTVAVRWPLGSVAAFTLMTSLFVLATTRTAAANAILLQYTAPIWVFLLAPLLLREPTRWSDGAMLTVAMLGVAVIFFGNPVTDRAALGIALASGVGYGALTVILRRLRDVNPWLVVCMNCLGSGAVLLAMMLADGSFAVPREKLWLLLALSAQFALPYFFFSHGLRFIRAQSASLLSLVETVLNPIWTFWIVGEIAPPATLQGGPLILIGVAGWVLLSWRRGQRTQ